MRHIDTPYEDQIFTQFSKFVPVGGAEDVSGVARVWRMNQSGYGVVVIASGGGSSDVTATITGTATASVFFSRNTYASAAGDGRGNPTTQAVLSYPLAYRRTNNDNVWMRQSAEWASATGDGEADDSPLHVSQIPKTYSEDIIGITGIYDDNPTSATSSAISLRRFTKGLVYIEFSVTSTPTDITLQLQQSNASDGTYYPYVMGPWASLVHDDTTIGAAGLKRCWDFDDWGEWCKIVVTTNGTTSSNKFGIDSAMITKKV